MVHLTVDRFFKNYITNWLALDLSIKDRMLAIFFSAILFPITLGIPHLISLHLRNRMIKKSWPELHQSNRDHFQAVRKVDLVMRKQLQTQSPVKLADVSSIIRNNFIEKCYAKELKKEVTVPCNDSWVNWNTLSTEKKIEVINQHALSHNRIHATCTAFQVNRALFAQGQNVFLENDPREFHGNDHCARAAIFSIIFAYLYHKYHPNYHLSQTDVITILLVASGHDSQRQTEGVDVYDEASADYTIEVMKQLGYQDPNLLQICRNAIANKDHTDLENKSLIAKCVQNADCADYVRLLLKGPKQDDPGFQNSLGYLDIYKEFSDLSSKEQNYSLKNGLTYGDFLTELEALREEINQIIFKTHSKESRKDFGYDAYDKILEIVTPSTYPSLFHALMKTGIKPNEEKKNHNQVESIIRDVRLENLDEDTLKSLIEGLHPSHRLWNLINQEIQNRKNALTNLPLVKQIPCEYAKYFSYLSSNEKRMHFKELKEVFKNRNMIVENTNPSILNAILFIEEMELNELLETCCNPDTLYSKASRVVSLYSLCDTNIRNPCIQTTCALAYESAAKLYAQSTDNLSARNVYEDAASKMIVENKQPLFDEHDFLNQAVKFLEKDCNFLRKRRLRLSAIRMEDKEYTEVTAELPSAIRKELEEKLKLFTHDTENVSAKYHQYDTDKKVYLSDKFITIGTDKQINLKDTQVLIGNNKQYWNQYHLMRIRLPKNATEYDLHKVFCQLGMPMGVMPSRKEDIDHEALARTIALRFPKLVHMSIPKKSSKELYELLSDDDRKVVDDDLKQVQRRYTDEHMIEIVNPTLPCEAWKNGARSLGTFIHAGNLEQTAKVLVDIIDHGFLSSQERYQRGILNFGCAPRYNNQVGSANQVFTRTFTKCFFEKQIPLKTFAVTGPILILIDLKAMERMPYSYFADRGGLRNPHYEQLLFTPQKQVPIPFYEGKERIMDRSSFKELIDQLEKNPHCLNETMFDIQLNPEYITRIIVSNDDEKQQLVEILEDAGIHQIGTKNLGDAIAVTDRLTPDLVDCYDEEEYPNSGPKVHYF